MSYDAIDDFAGPGGWDLGARWVGLETVGIEHDHSACMTAVAAGFARIRADVSTYPSSPFRGIRGYIGSPPCTLFSAAGSGVGKLVIDLLSAGITRIFNGDDCREEIRASIYPVTLMQAELKNAKRPIEKRWTEAKIIAKATSDAFVASLVLEPARRMVDLNPERVALEQVPEVLPLWQTYVRELRRRDYSAWTGVLNSADYGVPQTRRRAVVMASRVRAVSPPEPTHAEKDHHDDLFGAKRSKWVTFAEALGWGFEDRPAATISAGGAETGGAEIFANAQYRRRLTEYVIDRRTNSKAAGGTMAPTVPVSVDRPAPTLTGKSGHQWVIRPAWAYERPATTIVGSFKPEIVAAPGYRTDISRQDAPDSVSVSVSVSVSEAGVIQSFPADHPWCGTKGKKYQQVGNAIPPLLAAHILGALVGVPLERAA